MPERAPTPSPDGRTVGALGERAAIERIRARIPPAPSWVLVGIGDDAAVIEPDRNRADVITTDALVEHVHFDRQYMPPGAIGYKALAVNLSDLAAMGASPRSGVLSLILPPALAVSDLDALVDEMVALAVRHHVTLVGGNIARSPGPLIVDVTLVGSIRRRQILTRSGAKAGDAIYVSGTVGAAAAGLALCQAEVGTPADTDGGGRTEGGGLIKDGGLTEDGRRLTEDGRRLTEDGGRVFRPGDLRSDNPPGPVSADADPAIDAALEACRARFLRPEPRMRLGLIVGRTRAANACVDLSDGLADAVRQIADASGLGATVEADAIPVDEGARRWFERHGADPLDAALSGGEDYELLMTVPPRRRRAFFAAARLAGVAVTRIGAMTVGRRVVLRRADGPGDLPQGFMHFR